VDRDLLKEVDTSTSVQSRKDSRLGTPRSCRVSARELNPSTPTLQVWRLRTCHCIISPISAVTLRNSPWRKAPRRTSRTSRRSLARRRPVRVAASRWVTSPLRANTLFIELSNLRIDGGYVFNNPLHDSPDRTGLDGTQTVTCLDTLAQHLQPIMINILHLQPITINTLHVYSLQFVVKPQGHNGTHLHVTYMINREVTMSLRELKQILLPSDNSNMKE